MKTLALFSALILLPCFAQSGYAQSTTGGRSGGSTASTGAGYTIDGKRVTTSNPQSMTLADEGASRAYMYVPPASRTDAKNRSASPSGPDSSTVGTGRKQSGRKPSSRP